MIQLPWPVRKVFRTGIDDLAVERIWQRIRRRRAAPRRTWAQAQARVVAACALALAVLASTAGLMLLRPAPGIRRAAGPVRLLGGGELGSLVAGANETRPFALSDGSWVTLRPDSRIDVLENNAATFVTLLSSGGAGFKVQPGGPRRWTIECGLATVEVVGTRFSVFRDPFRVRVDVEHGVVLVRGERVRDHVQRLVDGQSLEVAAQPEPPAGGERPVADADAGEPLRTGRVPAPAADARWQDFARRGSYAEAYGLLGPGGVRRVNDMGSVEDLLTVADVARLSGHPADAVPALRRIIMEHPADSSAPLAAFTLGRVELDALGHPAEAADAFARAIAMGVPQGLLDDACARLVEARARANDMDGARQAADEYRARFAEGAHAGDVARWAPAR
jgi:transmembrane sensor